MLMVVSTPMTRLIDTSMRMMMTRR
jgi:hypothetical protein